MIVAVNAEPATGHEADSLPVIVDPSTRGRLRARVVLTLPDGRDAASVSRTVAVGLR